MGCCICRPTGSRVSTSQLTRSGPLIGALSSDPSLRGLVQALSFGLMGVGQGQITLDAMARTLNMAAEPIEKVRAGQTADFSWKVLLQGEAQPSDLRHFIAVSPYVNERELEPAAKAIAGIRQTANDLGLASNYRAQMRITGPAPIADEEFASANEGLVRNSLITGAIVVTILWLALHWFRLVFAVCVTLGVGLVVTAALGLLIVGALNPISIAFAMLFVGLGADFAIQYTVRYRAERHVVGDLHGALIVAADRVGAPLTLAAGAAAAGFMSFLPTPYIGLAQLGTIAGIGMGVAYAASLTLLPALVQALGTPPEPHSLRLPAMAPVDAWLKRHRILIVAVIAAAGVISLPALTRLQFDFDPLHLRDPNSESIATLRDLGKDPNVAVNAAEVITESPEEAAAVATRLAALPEVDHTRTIDSFVPPDQDRKLPLIQKAAVALGAALNRAPRPAPSDTENVAALRSGADALRKAAGDGSGAGRGCGAAPGGQPRMARGFGRSSSSGGLCRLHDATQGRLERPAGSPAGRPDQPREPSQGARARLGQPERQGARRGNPEGRPQRRGHAPALRACGPGGGAERHRSGDRHARMG